MSESQYPVLWQFQALPGETVRDAAERFVSESFGAGRTVRWGREPGEFWFPDGCFCYRIAFNGGHWEVRRTGEMTPQAKQRAKARRESRS